MENYLSYSGKEVLTSIRLYFGGQECCEAGHGFGPAVRKHYLIHFVESGCGTYTIENQTFSLQAGEAFLIYPDVLTYYEADSKNPWNYSWIAFDGHEVAYILEHCGFSRTHPVCEIGQVEECFEEIHFLTTHLSDSKVNEFTLTASLFKVFSYLYQETLIYQKEPYREYVSKAVSYLNHNYEYPIKIGDVASYIGIDRTYFYRIFQKELKMSPQEYLLKIRIEAGCQLLKDTKISITEVALSCGFKDSSSFCRSFRKACKKSPLEYRRDTMTFDYHI